MMGKAILITGIPCTGKTILAKELSLLLKKDVISTTIFAKKHSLFEKFDERRQTYPVDVKKLTSLLVKGIKKSEGTVIVEGHLSHFVPKENALICLVCKTDLPVLKKRLIERKYLEEKIRENLDSEIFETCLIEAVEEGHVVESVDTSKDIKNSVKNAIKALKKHKLTCP